MLITECNKLLTVFAGSRLDWKQGIREVCSANSDDMIQSVVTNIDKLISSNENLNQDSILIRWIAGSTLSIGNTFMSHLLPSDRSKVFQKLKSEKKILQVGGGRGKGFIVLNLDPFTHADTNEGVEEPQDPIALMKSLSDVVKNTSIDMKALKEKVAEQEIAISDKDTEINSLRQQIRNHNQSSWS